MNLIVHEQTFHTSWCVTAGPRLFWLCNGRHEGRVIFVVILAILLPRDVRVCQFVTLEYEIAMCRLHRIVQNDHRFGTERMPSFLMGVSILLLLLPCFVVAVVLVVSVSEVL